MSPTQELLSEVISVTAIVARGVGPSLLDRLRGSGVENIHTASGRSSLLDSRRGILSLFRPEVPLADEPVELRSLHLHRDGFRIVHRRNLPVHLADRGQRNGGDDQAVSLRRITATVLDGLLGMAGAVLLGKTPVGIYFAERAVVMFQIGQPASVWKGAIPMALGAVGEVVYALPFALAIAAGLEALVGRSPGKWLVGLGISTSRPEALFVRAAIKWVGCWGLLLALLSGSWLLALGSVIAGLGIVISVLLLHPLHDRISGARVEG